MTQDNDFIIFGAPLIEDDEINEVIDSMRSGWLGTGPKVAQFESDFRNYKSAEHSIAVNSCTAALHLSLLVSGVGPGDEVITTPMTFCATVNAIIHTGATPVLADIDPVTLNIAPEEIKRKISSNTKAILPVHFAGRPCNMNSIMEIARQNKLIVIEDCAHAIESEYHGIPTGTFGDFGCFSFYVTKNLATGEGGMITASSSKNIQRLKSLSLHGMSHDAWHRFGDSGYKHYKVIEPGFKYNMMDLQAAIGIHQLNKIDTNWLKRKSIWDKYQQAFADLPITIPADIEVDTKHAYHLYTIMINETLTGISRDEFLVKMKENNIGVGVHYLSIPEHPYYSNTYNWSTEDYPHAMKTGQEIVSLPLSAKLTEHEINRVIKAVKNIIR